MAVSLTCQSCGLACHQLLILPLKCVDHQCRKDTSTSRTSQNTSQYHSDVSEHQKEFWRMQIRSIVQQCFCQLNQPLLYLNVAKKNAVTKWTTWNHLLIRWRWRSPALSWRNNWRTTMPTNNNQNRWKPEATTKDTKDRWHFQVANTKQTNKNHGHRLYKSRRADKLPARQNTFHLAGKSAREPLRLK